MAVTSADRGEIDVLSAVDGLVQPSYQAVSHGLGCNLPPIYKFNNIDDI